MAINKMKIFWLLVVAMTTAQNIDIEPSATKIAAEK
jgi:hypothetical protein